MYPLPLTSLSSRPFPCLRFSPDPWWSGLPCQASWAPATFWLVKTAPVSPFLFLIFYSCFLISVFCCLCFSPDPWSELPGSHEHLPCSTYVLIGQDATCFSNLIGRDGNPSVTASKARARPQSWTTRQFCKIRFLSRNTVVLFFVTQYPKWMLLCLQRSSRRKTSSPTIWLWYW